MAGWAFSNSYAALPPRFFARLDPVAVADPRLIKFNGALAAELGLQWQDETPLAAIFAVSYASYRWVEQPFQRLKDRRLPMPAPLPAGVAPRDVVVLAG